MCPGTSNCPVIVIAKTDASMQDKNKVESCIRKVNVILTYLFTLPSRKVCDLYSNWDLTERAILEEVADAKHD